MAEIKKYEAVITCQTYGRQHLEKLVEVETDQGLIAANALIIRREIVGKKCTAENCGSPLVIDESTRLKQ